VGGKAVLFWRGLRLTTLRSLGYASRPGYLKPALCTLVLTAATVLAQGKAKVRKERRDCRGLTVIAYANGISNRR
jgi:hypothetical protein